MATAKKKTDAPTTRVAARPRAERRVEAAPEPVRASEPSYEAVSIRAFEIWERNGRQPGHDVEDWLQAEHELRSSSLA
jgi:hypothetical protein